MVLHDSDVILMTEPKYMHLRKKFEGVDNWESVCCYLFNDGQMHRAIRKNYYDEEVMRDEMLRRFLRNEPSPTWKCVLAALRNGNYYMLADEIERELQGWYMNCIMYCTDGYLRGFNFLWFRKLR